MEQTDHFVEKDGVLCAGVHLIIDFWGIQNATNISLIEKAIKEAIESSGATLLHVQLHHFTPSMGVSGVAILAESHISVHTWPERNFAAFDIFMCGQTDPQKCIPVLKKYFQPEKVDVFEKLRGMAQ